MAAFTLFNFSAFMTNIILIVISLVIYIGYYLSKKFSYWEKRKVPFAKPDSWFFGNAKDLILQRVPPAFVFQRIYNELDGYDYGGFYQLTSPALMLRDPELIKAVLVKDFAHFQDRTSAHSNEKVDPLSSHILNLSGKRWRDVRQKLTPTFSSGKLKDMHDLMQGCISELGDYLSKVTSGNTKDSDAQNVRELMAKFATDVIGACAFGLSCNAIRDEKSEFRRILSLGSSTKRMIYHLLRKLSPKLVDLVKIKLIHPEVDKFFRSVLKEAVEYRQLNARKRNDFLQLLINIQAEEKRQLESTPKQQNGAQNGNQNGHIENSLGKQKDILFTDNVVASNMHIFFVAGFETTATTLSYCLYELALNQEICRKMKDEVEMVRQNHGGNLDYDAMRELVYMDAVISETLRKYPVAAVTTRRCTESYQIPGSSVTIEKGTGVYVSIYGLHHDPKYFPEPEKFKPERFSEENKGTIVPGSYLPFGDGPRICIGMRFARYEMKSVLAYLVSNYTFQPCEKTVIPLQCDRKAALHTPDGGVWIRFQKKSTL